jgi:hypothetical protein
MSWAIGPFAEVWRSASRRSASLRSVQTCKQVWTCPVCGTRIMAGRAQEATEAVTQHLGNGGTVRMLTFTASHTRDDSLAELCARHAAAHERFWSRSSVKLSLKRCGSVGRITGQEVTFGEASGWHPHRHVLAFVEGMTDDEERLLKSAWVECCEHAGLSATYERGLDVRGGDDRVASYLAKLGLEVALLNAKSGRLSSCTPFGLIDGASLGDSRCADLFREFAGTMKGRRALWWSPGLKARFGIDDTTDEDLVEAPAEQDEQLHAHLHRDGLRLLSRHAAQGHFLALCGVDRVEDARRLLVEKGGDPDWVSCMLC